MLILFNGKVYTDYGFHEAVVADEKVIKYIGDSKTAISYANESPQFINLKGRLVLPGFIDSHAHGASFTAQTNNRIDLRNATTVDECLLTIEKYISEYPEKDFYLGAGWLSPIFGEKGPEKEMLDQICCEKPVIIRSGEGHSLWGNSKAIELAGISNETRCPEGGRIEKNEDGSIRGTFKEEANALLERIIPETTVDEFKSAIIQYQKDMIKYGYTTTSEMMISYNDNMHKAYIELADNDEMIIKTSLAFLLDPSDDIKKIGRANPELKNKLSQGQYIKLFIDGVVEGKTAWLKEPYSDEKDYCGEPRWKTDMLFKTCAVIEECGYDIHCHVIGDAALEQMISAVEYINENCIKRQNRRPVAAHVQLASPEDILRMKASGISVSANPYWFGVDEEYTELVEKPLLGERAKKQYPMKAFFDKGIVVSTGSDYSITPEPNPLEGIYMAVRRTMPGLDYNNPDNVLDVSECVSFEDMIKSVTIDGAYTLKLDEYTGSIKEDKLADMIVLDKDIFNIEFDDILNASVDMTISEGKIVYNKNGLPHP